MTEPSKSAATPRSTPKKPPETQTDGATAPVTPNRKKSKSRTAQKQETEEADEAETVKARKSSRRKREVEQIEERAVTEGTTSGSAKRQKTAVAKEKDEIKKPLLRKTKHKISLEVEEEINVGTEASPVRTKKETKVKEEFDEQTVTSARKTQTKSKVIGEAEVDEGGEKKVKRRRKTKEEKEAETMPLAARTNGLRMFIGAHVSGAKGVHNSVTNALHIGGNAFAMFLKSQRKWENPPLQDEHRDQFRAFCGEHKYDAASHILPHGSYLVNLAQEDPDRASQAYNAFLDDLQRCDALGIRLYNFHPGWTGPALRPSAIGRIAGALNRAHADTSRVTPVLEAMAGSGNVVGSTFEDLRDIIALVDDKARIGVCLDTCHIFAAGYDLRSPKAFNETLEEFDNIVGMKYLRALHINDSKAPLGSHRDLHQNLGLGFLGLRAFHNVMNEKRFEGLPLVLETPIDRKDENGKDIEDKGIWAREIKMLEGLIGTDAESEEFKRVEKELADKGAEEREKHQEAFERKKEKEMKKEKGQTKLSLGKKKPNIESDASASE
ncbi:MAG: hypothetical protein Q9217_005537 [Psora testacea]